MVANREFGQSYLVVTGEKGVGKTCLLKTVTSKTAGVIEVRAFPGDSADTIIKNTLQRLTRNVFVESATRVVFWYRFFTVGRSPIVVITATERSVGQEYADLAVAVRILVDDYKLRVIVDGSPNSFDESLLRTTRQRVVDIKPMTKEMIWQMGQLQELFKHVKDASLEDTVFAVLGGIPSKYEELWYNVKIDMRAGRDPREVIGSRLCAEVLDAIRILGQSKTKTNDMDEIIKLFDKDKKWICCDTVKMQKLQRPSPDIVFSQVMQDGASVLIPASNAIGIVLQHNLTKKPSLPELDELIKRML